MNKILLCSAALLSVMGCGPQHDTSSMKKEKLASIQRDIDNCLADADGCVGGFLIQDFGQDTDGNPIIRVRQIADCQFNCEWYQYSLADLRVLNENKRAAKELYGGEIVVCCYDSWDLAAALYAKQFVRRKQS